MGKTMILILLIVIIIFNSIIQAASLPETPEYEEPITYYSSYGPLTNPLKSINMLKDLPTDIPSLCKIVQNCIIHVYWANRYGIILSKDQQGEGIRSFSEMLARIYKLDKRSLTKERPDKKYLGGNCRNIAVFFCSLLRYKGIPARVRCGFASYFTPAYEEHWIVEYWKTDEKRWVKVDAQLSPEMRFALKIGFDPYSLPDGKFISAGQAWQMCRKNEADPNQFGVSDMRGMWFIRGDVVRDFASLNKVEMLPWDDWGLITKKDEELTSSDLALLDQVAALSINDNSYDLIRNIYEKEPGLRVPDELVK